MRRLAWLLLLVVGCAPAVARPPERDDPAARAKIERLVRARRLDAKSANYRIGAGDVCSVRVGGMDELTGTFTVAEDGTLTFPLVGAIRVRGLTEREGASRIESEISKFVSLPQVTLAVQEFHGRQVAVIGSVAQPGLYPLRAADQTLADVIADAGGITSDAGRRVFLAPAEGEGESTLASRQTIARLGFDEHAEQIEHRDSTIAIDLRPLESGRSIAELSIPMRAGDAVLVPKGGEVYVDGWVNTPGAFPLGTASTLTRAIASAGGLHFAASGGPVTLQRIGPRGQVETFAVDRAAIASGHEQDLDLDGGDRIRVAANPAKAAVWSVFAFVKGIFSFGVSGGVSVSR